MSPTTLPTTRLQPVGMLSGRHVLIAMVAFFGVIFAVNGVLLWQAVATHSGLVASEPYRKGLGYNRRIEADERQQSLGWTTLATVERSHGVSITLLDRLGEPVTGLQLVGTIGRPSTGHRDLALRFFEQAPGRYVAPVSGLDAGAWLLSVGAHAAGNERDGEGSSISDDAVYRMKRRLWLNP